jgi:hypothetical protein
MQDVGKSFAVVFEMLLCDVTEAFTLKDVQTINRSSSF